jgi:nitrogen fixation-related uncharacterized protein
MELAAIWMYQTVFAFMALALAGLAWSLATGQWQDLHEAARIPLDNDDPATEEPERFRRYEEE